jgi:hypothetical protein
MSFEPPSAANPQLRSQRHSNLDFMFGTSASVGSWYWVAAALISWSLLQFAAYL